MKNLLKTKVIGILAFIALFAVSCTNETTENEMESKTNDIPFSQVVIENPDFSMFEEAMNLTGMNPSSTAKGKGFTFFAPTNAAFNAFLKTTPYKSLLEVPRAVLVQILSNHSINERLLAKDLKTGYIKTNAIGSASNTNTLSMFVDTSKGVRLNGASNVIKANILIPNGVIHMVDTVIPLPTIVTHAIANNNFTSLVGALTSPGQPDFVTILSGNGPFTVFAPTNAAFTALNSELAPGGIAGVSAANLTKVLQYHVVAGANVLSTQLSNNQVVPSFLGQDVTVKFTPTRLVDVNNRNCNLIAFDVQCTNGVIHVLERVLLPSL